MKGLKGKMYEEWMESLDLLSLEERRLRADLSAAYGPHKDGGRGKH